MSSWTYLGILTSPRRIQLHLKSRLYDKNLYISSVLFPSDQWRVIAPPTQAAMHMRFITR